MIDEKKIETAIRMLLEGIGEDVERPGLMETPKRIANMYKEIYGGMDEDVSVHLGKTFPAINNEMVLEKDISFYSTCEHHLLPFTEKLILLIFRTIRLWGSVSSPERWMSMPEDLRSRSR